MALESNYEARLVIPRLNITLLAETWAGGVLDSDEAKYRTAATRKLKARGGKASRSNVVMKFECSAQLWALKDTLEPLSGIEPCRGIRQQLDERDTPVPGGQNVTGLIKSVKYPDYDLSSNNVGIVEIEISCDE